MKVKIKNKGKIEEFKLIESWEDVNLESWTRLVTSKTKTKSEEAIEVISELSNIPKKIIEKLELSDIAVIMARVGKMQSEVDTSLARIIEVEGKRYGFHPDLDSITLGEYADIETFIKNGIDKHLPEVMAVLYRPVTEETAKGIYTIEAYDGEIKIRAEQMKKMSSQQVQNALVFFYNFVKIFAMTMGLCLTERLKEMKMQSLQTDLQTSGVGSV